MKQFSPEDLFAAARTDRPSDEVLDGVWNRVSTVVAVPAAATTAVAVTAKTTAISVKSAVAFGVALGTAGTVLVAGALGTFDREGAEPSARSARVRTTLAHDGASGARLDDAPPRPRAEPTVAPPAPSPRVVAAPKRSVEDDGSALALEARLLTAARNALVREEPARALEVLSTVRHLPVRALEPEERRLEARALRALGRADEAAAIELELRRGSSAE